MYVHQIAISPDGQTIASTGSEYDEKLWDVDSGALKQTITRKKGKDHLLGPSVAFSPDGKILAIGGTPRVNLLDLSTGQFKGSPDGRVRTIGAIAFSHDGTMAVSGSPTTSEPFHPELRMVEIFDMSRGVLKMTLTGVTAGSELSFSPDGKTIITDGGSGVTNFWSIETGELKRVVKDYTWPGSCAFSPDGKILARGGFVTELWNLETGSRKDLEASVYVNALVFFPDGKTLVVAEDKTIKFWDCNGCP